MASLNQVSIELQVKGEREAVNALNRLETAQAKNIVSSNKAAQSAGVFIRAMDQMDKAARAQARANKYLREEMEREAIAFQKAAAESQKYINAVTMSARANKSAEASAEVFALQIERVERANLKTAQSFGEAVRAANSYTTANKSAAASADVFTQDLERLALKFNPLYAASQRYETQLNELNRAKALGVVNSKQYDAALEQLNTQLAMGATSASQMSRANHIASRQTNAYGMAMQQAGYQVGDFIVQVQSGTNGFVAFGQQATQLVGILPMLAGQFGLSVTKLIAVSSVLGVVIPLATALGAAFMRTRGEAKSFSDELDNLENVVSDLQGVQDVLSMSTEELGEKYGDAAASVKEYAQVEAQLQASLARSEMEDSLSTLDSLVDKYGRATKVADEFGDSIDISENLRAIEEDFGLVGNEAQKLQRAFSGIINAQTFDEQRQAVDNLLSSAEQFGLSLQDLPEPVAQMLLNFLKANRQIEEAEALIAALEQGLDSSSESSANLVESQERLNELLEKGRQAQLDRNRANMDAIREKEQELKMAQLIAEHGRDSVEVVRARAEQEAISLNLTTENQQRYIDLAVQAYEVSQAAKETANQLQRQVTHQMQIATMQKEVNAGVNAILASRDAELQKQQDRITLAQAELQFGKDSQEYKNAQLAIEERILREQLTQNNVLGNNAQKIIDAWKEANRLEQALEDGADATDDVASGLDNVIDRANKAARAAFGIFQALRNAAIELDVTEAGVAAAERVIARGGTDTQARVVQAGAEEEKRLSQLGVSGPELQGAVAQVMANERRRIEAERREREAFSVFDTDTGGTGGGTAPQLETGYLDGLLREAELKRQMAGLSEEEARRLEIINQLKDKELLVDDKLSEAQSRKIEQLLAEERMTERLIQQKKREEQIQQTVSSNIETALMSVVDGTKSVEDAFRGMLRNIILEIYKQQVAQPFAQQAGNFITSLFGFSNGGAFRGGNVVPFATGGVVGGPTYFPMTNGDTGLMGEAGPEAIMPLKRTKGGKLGVVAEGAGDVTVVQNFNISANGDDSVKRIVREEAPRIAEQAKAAVVDAKRRGGSYGRAFG